MVSKRIVELDVVGWWRTNSGSIAPCYSGHTAGPPKIARYQGSEKGGRRGKERRRRSDVPPENSTQKGGVEAFRRRESALNLCDCDLVLGGGGEEGEATGDGAEDVGGQGGHHQVLLHLQVAGEVRRGGGEGGGQGVLGVDGGPLVLGVHQLPPDQLVGGEGGRPLAVGGHQGEVGGGEGGGGEVCQRGGRREVGGLLRGASLLD